MDCGVFEMILKEIEILKRYERIGGTYNLSEFIQRIAPLLTRDNAESAMRAMSNHQRKIVAAWCQGGNGEISHHTELINLKGETVFSGAPRQDNAVILSILRGTLRETGHIDDDGQCVIDAED